MYTSWYIWNIPRITPVASVADGRGCWLIVKDEPIVAEQFTPETDVAGQGRAVLLSMKRRPQ